MDSCTIPFQNFYKGRQTSECTADPARYFVQFFCELSEQNMTANNKIAFFNSAVAYFVIALFLISLFIHRRNLHKEKLRVTKDLVRPSAFTTKFEISEELWAKVKERYSLDESEPSA
jgi:hypothetical protein